MGSASLLVVDDNEMNRDLLSRRLKKKGYVVTSVEDGYAALDAMADRPYDLVLLDIMMPGMSGLDVLRAFRSRHSRSRLPIIMATAKSDSKDVVEAMQLGANDYVTKPIDFPVLLARVEAQLAMREPAEAATIAPKADAGKLQPGSVIDNRYRLESVLGMGGYAVVYKAQQLSTGQAVAVKVLNPKVLAQVPDAKSEHGRFQQEMRIIAELNHPNIVQLFDCGSLQGGDLYTVLEHIEGSTLHETLRRNSGFEVREAVRLMGQVLEALAAAHARGIIHRDLKPANIMLARSGPRTHAKVLDFGISAVIRGDSGDTDHAEEGDELRGTPSFMAPEQVRGERVTPSVDVYAWGLILMQCITGKLAVRRSSRAATMLAHLDRKPLEVPDWIQADLREVITNATAKDSAQRYRSAQDAYDALEKCNVAVARRPKTGGPPPDLTENVDAQDTMLEARTMLTGPGTHSDDS